MIRKLATALVAVALATTANAQYHDAKGDAQNTLDGGAPLLDLATVSVTYDATTLYFTLTFFTPIAPATAGLPESLAGFLELDTDQNAGTGVPPTQNNFAPPFTELTAGWDYAILVADDPANPGTLFVLNSTFEVAGTVSAVFGPSSLSGQVPLSMLGDDDGVVDFTTTLGTFPQPTDATDSVATSGAAPEPGSVFCFGDGTGTTCPCGNDSSVPGQGCLHSGGAGMTLSSAGSASVSADNLALTVSNCPPGNAGLFFAGQTSFNPGIPLLDGLQCTGGNAIRFATHMAPTDGTVTGTGFVEQDVFGQFFAPGATYIFQYYSQDTAGGASPCGMGGNFSPAYVMTTTP